MAKRKKFFGKMNPPREMRPGISRGVRIVQSLLDAIEEGNEYGSIVGLLPPPEKNLLEDVVRGLREIENIRSRPCLLYAGNVVRPNLGDTGIDTTDDLPFWEMVSRVARDQPNVDVFLATMGGSAHQVSRFVNCLRSRFEEVDFLIPSFCMSAGTLFALSGDHIWMTARACLGPIDPQVPTKEGRYVPAQALILLVEELQRRGDEALAKKMSVPWTAVRIIDSLDKKEIGDAITATNYSTMMAKQFLEKYKFKNWSIRKDSGQPVTPEYREERAEAIASALGSHDKWKSHGHAISREVLWNEIKLMIDHPADNLEKVMLRLWALLYWLFDKTPGLKIIVSSQYKYIRSVPIHQEKQQ